MNLSDNCKPITVGDLKKALKNVPDDLLIAGVDGHSGEEDNIHFFVETDPECPGCADKNRPALVVMLG